MMAGIRIGVRFDVLAGSRQLSAVRLSTRVGHPTVRGETRRRWLGCAPRGAIGRSRWASENSIRRLLVYKTRLGDGVLAIILRFRSSSCASTSMAPMLPGQSSSARASLPSAEDGAVAFQRCLDGIFDEELAGLIGCSQRARRRVAEASSAQMEEMSAALNAAEAALAGVRAELQAERERSWKMTAAADVEAACAAGRIDGLKNTVKLQAARIVELEKKLCAQVALSKRLGARAARVPMLETRIAGLVAVEAQILKKARTLSEAGTSG